MIAIINWSLLFGTFKPLDRFFCISSKSCSTISLPLMESDEWHHTCWTRWQTDAIPAAAALSAIPVICAGLVAGLIVTYVTRPAYRIWVYAIYKRRGKPSGNNWYHYYHSPSLSTTYLYIKWLINRCVHRLSINILRATEFSYLPRVQQTIRE